MITTNKKVLINFLFVFITSITLFSCSSSKEVTPNFTSDFVGSFAMAESCGSNTDTYTVTVSTTSVDNQLLIKNFYGLVEVKATATSTTAFTINEQVVNSASGTEYTVKGSGALAAGKLTINFTVDGSSCVAIGSK